MAEARQKEMKVNITVVATKTFMAGFEPSTDVAMLRRNARPQIRTNFEDSTAGGESGAFPRLKLDRGRRTGKADSHQRLALAAPAALAATVPETGMCG